MERQAERQASKMIRKPLNRYDMKDINEDISGKTSNQNDKQRSE